MDLYTRLYGHRASDDPPTQRQLASQTNPINAGKQVLPQAEDMAKQYPEQVDEEELQKMIEEMEDSNEEAEGRTQAASEGGEATELQAADENERKTENVSDAATTTAAADIMVTETTNAQSFPCLPTPPSSRDNA